ncbi:MAG: leucine-rich repeat domain-containing protein [Oligoflexales bacterium]
MAKISKFYQRSLILLILTSCKSKTEDTSWQDCQNRGGTWRINECLFQLSEQESCLNQKNGSEWRESTCISTEEKKCLEKNHIWDRFQCLPPTLTSCSLKGENWIYENETCREKEFLDYCLHDSKHSFLRILKKTLKTEDCDSLLTQFQHLKTLNLSHETFQDLKLLKEATQLLSLTLDHTTFPPQDLLAPRLEVLIARNIKAINLKFIQNLISLQYLDISHNQITELSQLHSFPELEVLIATDNQIIKIKDTDIPASLKRLNLNQNSLHEITLSDLKAIEHLEATGNHISAVSLKKAEHLKKLIIDGQKTTSQLTEINWLKELNSLEHISLSDHAIQDITSIQFLPLLKVIEMERNQIDNITPFQSLENIRSISLSGNPIHFLHRRTPDTCPLNALSQVVSKYCETDQ